MRYPLTAVCALAFLLTAGAQEIDLAGTWRLVQSDDPEVSCPAQVPGGIYAALVEAGRLPEPGFGLNELKVQWPRLKDWIFSRTVDIPAGFAARKSVVLRLEGVDLVASVRLNGQEAGLLCDRFVRHDLDVTGLLKPGRNEIEIRFGSTELASVREAATYGRIYPRGAALKLPYLNLMRTVQCKAGWDWGPVLMDTGVMDRIALIASDSPRVDYVYTRQSFNEDLSHCTLDVFADLSDGTVVTNRIEIDDPPLWWPNGYGRQELYAFAVDVNGERISRRIGLRKLSVDRRDGALGFAINGVPVFAKGANWIPADAIENRQTPDRYRQLLGDAAKANMNMIRVWGGGKFERDCFYDLCDELGLMVWQDFPFAGAVYPEEDRFYDRVRGEVRHQLKRLRDHASIVLWCGDNECVNACRDFMAELREPEPGIFLKNAVRRERFLSDLVAEYDPDRLFWPSSPSPGPGATEQGVFQNDDSGDRHVWSVWFGPHLPGHYHVQHPRFCSEFGFQSFPSREGVAAFGPGEDALRFHQRSARGNERILEMLDRFFDYPRGRGAELYLSQVQQAIFVRTGIESWRAQAPRCRGSLYWQLNDVWPATSWSSIEHSGRWKQLHYHVRRAYAPVAVIPVPQESGGWSLVVANDTREAIAGELRIRLFDFRGREIRSERVPARAEPLTATRIAVRPRAAFGSESDLPGRFIQFEFHGNGRRLATNHAFFAPFRACRLEKPNVRTEFDARRTAVTLSTDVPAFFVWATEDGVRGEFDDNSVVLLPGEPRTLEFFGRERLGIDAFREKFGVCNLMEICEAGANR